MRRRENKNGGGRGAGPRPSRNPAPITVPVNEVDIMTQTLGVANITRDYLTTDVGRTPPLIFRNMDPFFGFKDGFSLSSDSNSAPSKVVATDVTEDDPTKALYAITRTASEFQERIYPVMENVFQSGLGSRHSVSFGEVVRYFACVIEMYDLMLNILKINHLAYHYEWKNVFPYVGTPPLWLYKFARHNLCTDTEIAALWLPLMQRIERKCLFPSIVEEMKRLHTPMYPVNGSVVYCPFSSADGTDYYLGKKWGEGIYERITNLLDYVGTVLNQTDSLVRTFLPLLIVDMQPWTGFATPTIDEDRWVAWINSGVNPQTNRAFDDSNDPLLLTDIVYSLNGGDNLDPTFDWFTMDAQPMWGRVRLATIFELFNATDDYWICETLHRLGFFSWFGDDSEITEDKDGVEPMESFTRNNNSFGALDDDKANIAMNLIPSTRRFAGDLSADNAGPLPDHGLIHSSVPGDAILRNVQYDAQRMFSYDALRQLELMAAGSSLREVKATLLGVAVKHA